MQTSSTLRLKFLRGACQLLALSALTSCELPPREAWNIIQRDGLVTYWSREYNPTIAPSRYLQPNNGSPFAPSPAPRVPYRPRYSENRYLASAADAPSRRRTRTSARSSYERPSEPKKTPPPPTPKILLEPSSTASAPQPKSPAAEAPKPSMETLLYGTPVPGRPGMVNSPYATQQQLVDVTGMAPGEAVKDPYSGKLFRVPPVQQAAAAKTEPAAEAPATPETPAEEAKPQP